MISLILSILVPTLLGLLLLAVLLRQETGTSLLLRLGMSFPLGMGLITIQIFCLGLLRVPLTLPFVVSLPIAEIVALAFASWRTKAPVIPLSPAPARRRRSWTVIALIIILFCWSLIKIGSVFLESTLRPIYAWDAWANWSAGAKAFFYSHSLLLDAPPQDFFGKGIVSRFIEYPLHNALSQVWFALWVGGFDEALVKTASPMAIACLAAAIFSIGKREIGTVFALLTLVIFLSSPLLSYHGVEAYSDLHLGMFIFLALTAFSLSMQGNRAYWTITGLFSALALFTKDEAPFFVGPLMASAIVFILTARPETVPSRRRALAGLLLPLFLAAPWFLFKVVNHIGVGAGGIKFSLTFQPVVLGQMVTQLLSFNNFFLVPLFCVILLFLPGWPSRETLHLAAPIACFIAFFASLYCLTTYYYEFFSNGTVFFRNVLTWYPSLCLLIILSLRRLLPPEWRDAATSATASRR